MYTTFSKQKVTEDIMRKNKCKHGFSKLVGDGEEEDDDDGDGNNYDSSSCLFLLLRIFEFPILND